MVKMQLDKLRNGTKPDAARNAAGPLSSRPSESSPTITSGNTNAAIGPANLPDVIIPAGKIYIIGMALRQFIPIYAEIADAQLDVSQFGTLPLVIVRFSNTNDVTRSEAVRLLDKMLYNQAGIVAVHADAKHVQFKYRSSESEK